LRRIPAFYKVPCRMCDTGSVAGAGLFFLATGCTASTQTALRSPLCVHHPLCADFTCRILSLPKARCPVLKAVHSASGLAVDVTFENRCVLPNTILYCLAVVHMPISCSCEWLLCMCMQSARSVLSNISRRVGGGGTRCNMYSLTAGILMLITALPHCHTARTATYHEPC